jgi:two-component system sensor histidine kinase KdpD
MLYVPLQASGHRLGVIGVRPDPPERMADPGQRQLLETIVDQTALALERSALANAARLAHLEAEAEKLRTSLLSSLSHDMRTPLASIQGAASALLSDTVTEAARHDLAQTVLEESRRMDRLVANLLDMIRLESGAMQVERQWHVLEDIVGVALLRVGDRLRDHVVTTAFPRDLPMVPVDDVLLEQVFVNLLENAAKHTPPGTAVEIGAQAVEGAVEVWVADRGPGFLPGDETRIFEKFQRGPGAAPGVGLVLTTVRGIVQAHQGRIRAEPRPAGGAIFRMTLPLVGTPPVVPPETTTEP